MMADPLLSINHITVARLTWVGAEEDASCSAPSCDSCAPDVSAMWLSLELRPLSEGLRQKL